MHTALSWSLRFLIASFYRPMSLLLFSDPFFPVMFLTGHTLCSTLFFPPHFHYILGRTMNADSKFTQWQQRAEHTENWHQVHLDDRESCRVTQKQSNIGWVWWTKRQWGGGQCLWAHRGTYSDLEWEKSLGTFPPNNHKVPLACDCLCFHRSLRSREIIQIRRMTQSVPRMYKDIRLL